MIWLVLVYHILLVLVAYRVGRNSAAPGVIVFIVGVVLFQLFVNGPASFIEPSGCDYGVRARDC